MYLDEERTLTLKLLGSRSSEATPTSALQVAREIRRFVEVGSSVCRLCAKDRCWGSDNDIDAYPHSTSVRAF